MSRNPPLFRTQIPVRYHEVDHTGSVYLPRILAWLDLAREQMAESFEAQDLVPKTWGRALRLSPRKLEVERRACFGHHPGIEVLVFLEASEAGLEVGYSLVRDGHEVVRAKTEHPLEIEGPALEHFRNRVLGLEAAPLSWAHPETQRLVEEKSPD